MTTGAQDRYLMATPNKLLRRYGWDKQADYLMVPLLEFRISEILASISVGCHANPLTLPPELLNHIVSYLNVATPMLLVSRQSNELVSVYRNPRSAKEREEWLDERLAIFNRSFHVNLQRGRDMRYAWCLPLDEEAAIKLKTKLNAIFFPFGDLLKEL